MHLGLHEITDHCVWIAQPLSGKAYCAVPSIFLVFLTLNS